MTTLNYKYEVRLDMWMRVLVAAMLFVLSFIGSAAHATPPNVVMIISDDQGWTDYGFMGHEQIRTPRLDQLAKESALFRRGYVPSSLCRPSLATLVTGLYPHQHKISGNDPAGKRGARGNELREQVIAHIDNVPTLPRLLATKGYLSLQTGKWWEGNYRRGGFTHGMTRGFPEKGGRHGDDGLTIGRKGMKPIIDFIHTAEEQEKPFFIWYAPFMPHTPHNPPERLSKKYVDAGATRKDAAYYAMCEWFDETVGQLLDHLADRNLEDNTLIVYVTDNGWKQGSAGSQLRGGKRSPHEGGIRTPIMLRWPGHVKPRDYDAAVSSIDLVPTILSACDLKPTANMQGRNLLLAANGEELSRDTIFGETFAHDVADIDHPARSLQYRWAIEDARWKLILDAESEQRELYDLSTDPHEKNNVASSKPDIVRRLTGKLDAWWTPGR